MIDDTPCFLTIIILPPSTLTVQLQIHFCPLPPLSYAQAHTHTSPQPQVVVSSSTLSALSIHKDLSLDSVRMVLLDRVAISCECHVIDDTPRFLIIVILKTSICDCSVAHSFLTSSLSLLHKSTHIHLTPATWLFLHGHCVFPAPTRTSASTLLGWCCGMELVRVSVM